MMVSGIPRSGDGPRAQLRRNIRWLNTRKLAAECVFITAQKPAISEPPRFGG